MTRTTRVVSSALLLLIAAACSTRDGGTDTTAGVTSAAVTPPPATTDTAAGATAAAGAPTTGGFLDPETATREQLLAIPGMDAALADSLVAKRPYADMRAVDRVLAGKLSEAQRDTVYTRLFKPIDVNKATAQEIELIPGVGPRMRREFLEYRPYANIEQFRREIGKYVDAAELARLEKYVRIGQ